MSDKAVLSREVLKESVSLRQALIYHFPEAYFLVRQYMCRAEAKYEEVTGDIRLEGQETRLERRVREEMRRHATLLGDQDFLSEEPAPIEFRSYTRVVPRLDPAVFYCQRCKQVHNLTSKVLSGKISPHDFLCKSCGNLPMSQLVWTFVHPRCGSVRSIEPMYCPHCKNTPMLLEIDRRSFGRTHWYCSKCETQMPLSFPCAVCSGPQGTQMMRPAPAASAIKPASVQAVRDVGGGIESFLQDEIGFDTSSLKEDILNSTPPQFKSAVEHAMKDEAAWEQLKEDYLSRNPEKRASYQQITDLARGLDWKVKASIEDFSGIKALIGPRGWLHSEQSYRERAAAIKKDTGIEIAYISDLPLVNITYGYTVGTKEESVAKLIPFYNDMGTVQALVEPYTTEGLLFKLDQKLTKDWLLKKQVLKPEQDFRQELLLSPDASETSFTVLKLLHTLSHLLIRISEIFSGVPRDNLSELIMGPALSFAIYSTEGSELGALRTTFESPQINQWIKWALKNASACTYDPLCTDGQHGKVGCHACLFISERNCNTYYNNFLDRGLIKTITAEPGYFG